MVNFDVVNDIPTTNKTILLLTDLDVPIDENGKIVNDGKIQQAMLTINYLIKTGARVVIATHLGHPSNELDQRYSTKPIVKYLDKRLHCNVSFCPTCIGEQSRREIFKAEYGDVVVLENLLFFSGERDCDVNFARQLTDGVNIYVNDAFSFSNYNYASVLLAPLFVRATGGLVLKNNIENLDLFLSCSNRFTFSIIGGKMADKIDLLYNLSERTKCIAVGGIVANNFLKAFGYNIGKSQFEPRCVEEAGKIFENANKNDCLLALPNDVVVSENLQGDATTKDVRNLNKDDIIVDLGGESVKNICDILNLSRCVFCYGNIGISEISNSNMASIAIFDEISKLTKKGRLFSVISGQDTILSAQKSNYLDKFSFTSNASVSTLQYMSGKNLPGLEVLKRLSK